MSIPSSVLAASESKKNFAAAREADDVAALRAAGAHAEFLPVDLTDAASVESFAQAVAAKFGAVDILVVSRRMIARECPIEISGRRIHAERIKHQALHRRVNTGFLEYASYVIRDRAIAALTDGLKPVQRRILWALKRTDDGRFTKVANVVGDTMKFHPHGDASIGDALVVLANKRYLIEGQGNFGNIFNFYRNAIYLFDK